MKVQRSSLTLKDELSYFCLLISSVTGLGHAVQQILHIKNYDKLRLYHRSQESQFFSSLDRHDNRQWGMKANIATARFNTFTL